MTYRFFYHLVASFFLLLGITHHNINAGKLAKVQGATPQQTSSVLHNIFSCKSKSPHKIIPHQMQTIQQAIPHEERYHRFLDMIIIIDTNKKSNKSMLNNLTIALLQEASPILVTREIWSRLLVQKNRNFIASCILNDPPLNGLNLNNFFIYQGVKGPEWFLIIPKKYRERLIQNNQELIRTIRNIEATTPITTITPAEEEILLGLKTDESSGILVKRNAQEIYFSETLYKTPRKFPAFQDTTDTAMVDHFLELFIPCNPKDNTSNHAKDFCGIWNFIIGGHGSYQYNHEEIITKDGIRTDILGYNAYIAGLPIPLFRNLIDYWTKNLHVNVVYYSTCYGGDNNLRIPYAQKLIRETTQNSNKVWLVKSASRIHFTVIVGALTSKVTMGHSYYDVYTCNNARKKDSHKAIIMPEDSQDFARYFYFLHYYGAIPKQEALHAVKYQKEQLNHILKFVTMIYKTSSERFSTREFFSILDIHGISTLPSVKTPAYDQFYPHPLDDTISIISPFTIALHQIKQQTKVDKTLVIKNKNALLLCASHIPLDLKIECNRGNYPTIVSMLPGNPWHTIDSLHISGLGYYHSVSSYLGSSFALKVLKKLFSIYPIFAKYFYIKKLQIGNHIFNNVLIYIQQDETNNKSKLAAAFTRPDATGKSNVYYWNGSSEKKASISFVKPGDLHNDFAFIISEYGQDSQITELLNFKLP